MCYSGAPSSPRVCCVSPLGETQRTSVEGGEVITYETNENGDRVMVNKKIARPANTATATARSPLPGFVREGYVHGIIDAHETNEQRRERVKANVERAVKDAKVDRNIARQARREKRQAQAHDNPIC